MGAKKKIRKMSKKSVDLRGLDKYFVRSDECEGQCVYLLFNTRKTTSPIYIGETTDLAHRLNQHRTHKPHDLVMHLPTPRKTANGRRALQQALINYFLPELNKQAADIGGQLCRRILRRHGIEDCYGSASF